jgi:hypothetical protein
MKYSVTVEILYWFKNFSSKTAFVTFLLELNSTGRMILSRLAIFNFP